MRTSDKLCNAKVKQAGSGHGLGEGEEGLRVAAAGVGGPAEPVKGGGGKSHSVPHLQVWDTHSTKGTEEKGHLQA